jgi:hydroxymethylglutaryl-CoA reductase (NADPH)
MGMNMVTIASEKAAELIEKECKAKCISLAGNFDIDKKPAWLNFINGRGRRVWAEATLSKKVVKEVLKTTPESFHNLAIKKCQIGSALSGSLGFNAHFANIIAAIFIATGQDIAHVVEGSMGITNTEVDNNGDLYVSIYLPALLLGTLGGGTNLPCQRECLELMGLKPNGDVVKFASTVGAAVLAGEISLLASQAEGSLARAHKKHGRNGGS